MKKLLACSSMFISSLAMAQAVPSGNDWGQFWIEGKTLTLAYSSAGAPSGITNAQMLQILADIEGDIDALNIPSLQVQVDLTVRTTGCDLGQNTVVICWSPIPGNTGGFTNASGGGGANWWREATILLDNDTTPWSGSPQIFASTLHQLMHIVGFGHPEGSGTSILNGAPELTQVDIDGLRSVYSANRCTLTYNPTSRAINIPFVTYRGNAYNATILHNGGASFSLLPGTSMYTATDAPKTGCQGIAVDANNQLQLPKVNVNGTVMWGNFTLSNGSLTLTASGQ
jgi:hypothetical protein